MVFSVHVFVHVSRQRSCRPKLIFKIFQCCITFGCSIFCWRRLKSLREVITPKAYKHHVVFLCAVIAHVCQGFTSALASESGSDRFHRAAVAYRHGRAANAGRAYEMFVKKRPERLYLFKTLFIVIGRIALSMLSLHPAANVVILFGFVTSYRRTVFRWIQRVTGTKQLHTGVTDLRLSTTVFCDNEGWSMLRTLSPLTMLP